MQVIILADGEVATRAAIDAAWPGWLDPAARVVAADGGARHAGPLGLSIDRWVGDGDSLGEDGIAALLAAGVPVDRARPDKDESDTELAISAALAMTPDAIVVIGALGGPRIDHASANLGLLSLPALAGLDVRLVAADARVRLLQAPGAHGDAVSLDLSGPSDDLVSLLPVGEDALGVTTVGLVYPLDDEPLLVGRTRGLSNVRLGDGPTSVTLRRGRIIVVETPVRSEP